MDGSGYPDGLKGDEITPLVRIAAVADIFDALTTDRAYRSRHTPEEACQILRDMKYKIDQDVVDVFVETLKETGKLSSQTDVEVDKDRHSQIERETS